MLALLLALAPLAAGEIFGDLRAGDGYLADVTLTLTCGADTVSAKTDKEGSYRIRTSGSGRCTLTAAYKDQSPSVDVVVFERPTRYRLLLEQVDGKWILKRV